MDRDSKVLQEVLADLKKNCSEVSGRTQICPDGYKTVLTGCFVDFLDGFKIAWVFPCDTNISGLFLKLSRCF